MSDWLQSLLANLAGTPWLQGLLAALATFILEDPTTVGSGLLVADGKMTFTTAFLGVSAGIAIGDLGLYAGGRWLGPRIIGRGPLTNNRMDRAASWFHRNLVQTVVLSRFVPGMRLPTYVAAGALKAPFWRFAVTAVAASLGWTVLLLTLTVKLGETILPHLGRWRWPVAAVALLMLVLIQRRVAVSIETRQTPNRPIVPVTSSFELWPPWLFYLPVTFHWLWLAIRHRGLLLPTAANPSIYSGGFIGESKAQVLDLIPDPHRRRVARWVAVVAPAGPASLDEAMDRARGALEDARLDYPLVAKPDIGQRGVGVWPLDHEEDLRRYLVAFPAGRTALLQEYAGRRPPGRPDDHPSGFGDVREAGILWWRLPGEARGRVVSMTLKITPAMVGDGRRTLGQLIMDDPRAHRLAATYLKRHALNCSRILAEGETYPLVFAGNHCQGAIFKNGTGLVTTELERSIDDIARAIPEFWFGRFDVRFDDLDELLSGERFTIIEVNGAAAEATHIWDASTTLSEAYRTLFEQFGTLFVIGAANRRRGHPPLPLRRFLRDVTAYRRLSRGYPPAR